jgi:S-adenosylmethionine:tRNA ribosyltransferase-isomerase
MHLSDFDFPFDPALIADRPVEPRDEARLLVLRREDVPLVHQRILDLPALLSPGDLLVVNDTKVLAARLVGRKRPGGGTVEVLLVREREPGTWEVLLKGKIRPGTVIEFDMGVIAEVAGRNEAGTILRFPEGTSVRARLPQIGLMPLPPYIKRPPTERDRAWYQTIFARSEGSIAAPTAGLHFTQRLLEGLQARGIGLAAVTLHVGTATFRPVGAERVEEHVMPPEWMAVSAETAAKVRETKAQGGRVVAVGTTVVRTLEAMSGEDGDLRHGSGETRLFILPGHRFRVVDAILTNFHLPRTTLVMLVAAFGGLDRLREAYGEAVRERYRFYSYGDAMLLL